MTKLETPNGKELAIVRCPKTAHLNIQFTTGGELPQELSGIYTSEAFAKKAITSYLENKKPVVKEVKETEVPKDKKE